MKRILTMSLTFVMFLSATTYGSSSAVSGASDAAAALESSRGKTDLVIVTATKMITLNPQDSWDGNSLYVIRQLHNGLAKLNDKMEIVDDLTESWRFTSDIPMTLKLRHSVKFHNDDEVKASDVVYSIGRARKSIKIETFTANTVSVTAGDNYTVTTETNISYAPLISNLCHTADPIASQKATEAAGDKFSASPVGTDLLKSIKWDFGNKIALEENADYSAETIEPTSLTFKLTGKGSARTTALGTGEVDLNLTVVASDAKRISEEDSMKLVTSMDPKIEYISMNQKEEPFDNTLVRQAINYAIDHRPLNTVAAAGYGEVTDFVMNKQINGYTDDIARYDYNPEKVKELPKRAGYENGFETTILVSGDTRDTEVQLIQANLVEVGVNVTTNTAESTAMFEQINNDGYKMFIMSYNGTTGDPDTSLCMLFNPEVPTSSGNRSLTNIPGVDQKLEATRVETDADARMEIYVELQKTLTGQVVWVPLYCTPNLIGVRGDLSGYAPHLLGNDVFGQLSYE